MKLGKAIGLLESLTSEMAESNKNMKNHIQEADKEGGIRDRVKALEKGQRQQIIYCFIAALMGGMMAQAAPKFFMLLGHIVGKYFGM